MIPGMEPRPEAEGGCGVIGLACSVPVEGRHIILPSQRMHNRGNGKGGGVAAMGLDPAQMRVTPELLRDDYLIQIAYLDAASRGDVEKRFLAPHFRIDQAYEIDELADHRDAGLELRPPRVWRYYGRVKPEALDRFAAEKGMQILARAELEDEFVYRNSFRLNSEFYASGPQRAFVLCHGKNLAVFKAVGYAEEAARFYKLDALRAKIWIAHQRYPTKGKVWHPGGAHPFIGLYEALVHNGDFANYHSIVEYLAQRNLRPLFLTDTEVAVLLFDLLRRVYKYPLEYVIEALAPTTERDFAMLPKEKRDLYRRIQAAHMHGSPDGPWFFIVARNDVAGRALNLIGITDTSMLRPQVFALYRGEVAIGLIASEQQAIDATLESLSKEDPRFCPAADRTWNARGGSYTDGGAFVFSIAESGELRVTDKFGNVVDVEPREPCVDARVSKRRVETLEELRDVAARGSYADLRGALETCERLDWLTDLLDRRVRVAPKKQSWVRAFALAAIERLLATRPPADAATIDCAGLPPEGPRGASALIVDKYHREGARNFVVFRAQGHRFLGCGLDLKSDAFRMSVYGSPGDYLGSGLDGGWIEVHGPGQDQLAQIMRRGRLVVHGDVGQTFLYGAKGGEVYVLGNAAGRPLINAVGRPRVVFNGTALDYLAESFMAGDPLKGGGFAILNGLARTEDGEFVDLPEPYPGGNLFSLASGGAIYLRDPRRLVGEEQLNGGRFVDLKPADWALIEPHLRENERLFGISLERLLGGDPPEKVYRKVAAVRLAALAVSFAGE
jgi:glutamate synthase domain-containing protein 1/glutamate synthase domain-containing protein 3